jgi:hypothetical protein
MNKLLAASAPLLPSIAMPDSPFHQLQSFSRSELAVTRSIPAAHVWRINFHLALDFWTAQAAQPTCCAAAIELLRWRTRSSPYFP